MTKEQILDACAMRLDGHALQEIADKYGVTKQRIMMLVPKTGGGRKLYGDSVYPQIKAWLSENRMSNKRLGVMLGVSNTTLSRWLMGGDTIPKAKIDKILSLTGLTYEQAFKKENGA